MFWSTTYAASGYIFSGQLDRVAAQLARVGALVALAAAIGFGFYVVPRFARWPLSSRVAKTSELARTVNESGGVAAGHIDWPNAPHHPKRSATAERKTARELTARTRS